MRYFSFRWLYVYSLILIFPSTIRADIPYVSPQQTYEEIITGLSPDLDSADITPWQHPAEEITEKTIEGIWETIQTKVPFTFSSKPISMASGLKTVLEKIYSFLGPILEEYDIEHNNVTEYSNMLPVTFGKGAFEIIAYDPYSTKDRLSPNPVSTSDVPLFRVKMYPEFAANDASEFVLKNLEVLRLSSKPTSQNMIVEFYTANDDVLVDKLHLPARMANDQFGACLTKAKSRSYINYQKQHPYSYAREPGRQKTRCTWNNRAPNCAVSNSWVLLNVIDPLWPKTSFNTSFTHQTWESMTDDQRAYYGPMMWQNTITVSKSEISPMDPDYQLKLWRDPDWLLRSDHMFVYGNNYYNDFAQNGQVIVETDEHGYKKPNQGIRFSDDGKAYYQVYVPRNGQYELTLAFSHEAAAALTVRSALDKSIIFSTEAPAPEDGLKHLKVSVPREIDLQQGLLYISVEGSHLDYHYMLLSYVGNREEERYEYLETQRDLIRREVVGAIFHMDEHMTTRDEIGDSIEHVHFTLKHLVKRRYEELKAREYSPSEPLMQEIRRFIKQLEDRIAKAQRDYDQYPDDTEILIHGADVVRSNDYVKLRGNEALFIGESLFEGKIGDASYQVTIPRSGYYRTEYIISTYDVGASINVQDENNRTFYSTRLPRTSDSIFSPRYEAITSDDAREYFEAGDTIINIWCTNGRFTLQKFKLTFDGA